MLIFLPHEPIFYDSAGNYLPEELIYDKKTVLNKNYYLGYIKYINTRIHSFVNAIVSNNPGAIIIIMSDHGYKHTVSNAISLDNICAVRAGNTDCLTDTIKSPV